MEEKRFRERRENLSVSRSRLTLRVGFRTSTRSPAAELTVVFVAVSFRAAYFCWSPSPSRREKRRANNKKKRRAQPQECFHRDIKSANILLDRCPHACQKSLVRFQGTVPFSGIRAAPHV